MCLRHQDDIPHHASSSSFPDASHETPNVEPALVFQLFSQLCTLPHHQGSYTWLMEGPPRRTPPRMLTPDERPAVMEKKSEAAQAAQPN